MPGPPQAVDGSSGMWPFSKTSDLTEARSWLPVKRPILRRKRRRNAQSTRPSQVIRWVRKAKGSEPPGFVWYFAVGVKTLRTQELLFCKAQAAALL